MSYALSVQFRVDASGRSIAPEPTHGMEAAARYYLARNYAEAERCCLELVERDARHFDALHLLGVLCLDQRQLSDAVSYLTRAARERDDNSQANYNLGTALLGLKMYEQAETALRRSLAIQAEDAGTLNNLSNVLIDVGRYAEALECCERVLSAVPTHMPARYNMGRALAGLDRVEDAITAFRDVLAKAPLDTEPDRLVDVHASLGQALLDVGRYDEAIAQCHAMAEFRTDAAAWNESLVLLLLGRFVEGWRKYERRWHAPDHDPPRPDQTIPDLTEFTGKRVLLIPEQGHGDLIQFARYVPLLAAQGARVSLQTYPRLKALMRTLDGVMRVVAPEDKEPSADIVTPLLSLPLIFGTALDTIPAQVPYLHVPTTRLAAWRRRLGKRTRRRIGLFWWGSQHIPKRSLPIETLQPILSMPDFEFHSLQLETPQVHRDYLAAHAALADHGTAQSDFADTAALISLLDLVVTIDTAVAHLAGALGKPVWIMLHHNADWRWLLHRNDSPWYPTARLFRQPHSGDWAGVVADVVERLRSFDA